MNNLHYLSEKATFRDVLKTLSLPGVRRVPMMSRKLFRDVSKRPMARFITQSDVIHFVANNLSDFGSGLDLKVHSNIGTYPVTCVQETIRTIDAFREMLNQKVTGLAVVDITGNLVGNLSIRDIGYAVTASPGTELNMDLRSFLSALKANGYNSDFVFCKTHDTIAHAITELSKSRTHRMYVMDDANKPCGVITLSDICKFLLQLPAYTVPTKHGLNSKDL
jgi:CBS domain-containing protein